MLVLGVRGSGEAPQPGISAVEYTTDPNNGLGMINQGMYAALSNKKLRIESSGVVYPALPVLDGLAPSLVTLPGEYLKEVKTAADQLRKQLNETDVYCNKQVKFVLSGYSSGAWVVHRALYDMEDRKQRDRIVGVTLFGDPLFVPHQGIVRENKQYLRNYGVAASFQVDTPHEDVPKDIRARTASYCNIGDPVCQIGNSDIAPHLAYVQNGLAAEAAAFVQKLRNWPSTSNWPGGVCVVTQGSLGPVGGCF